MNQPVFGPAALGGYSGDHGACGCICVANRLQPIGFESGQRHRASKPAQSADLPTKHYLFQGISLDLGH